LGQRRRTLQSRDEQHRWQRGDADLENKLLLMLHDHLLQKGQRGN